MPLILRCVGSELKHGVEFQFSSLSDSPSLKQMNMWGLIRVCVSAYVCLFVCVCVRERDKRQKEMREGETESEIDLEKDRMKGKRGIEQRRERERARDRQRDFFFLLATVTKGVWSSQIRHESGMLGRPEQRKKKKKNPAVKASR